MPKVQGVFIDKSQLGTMGSNAAQSSGVETGGDTGSTSKLQQMLGMYALYKGNPTGAWSILSQQPPDTTGTTPAEKSRATTGLSVANSVANVPKPTLLKTGTPGAALVNLKLNFPLKLGQPTITEKEKDLVDLDSKYFLLTQAVLTAVQGSRPSDYDVKSYQNSAGPNIMLPNYINEQRIRNLQNLLRTKAGQPELPDKPDLSSFNQP